MAARMKLGPRAVRGRDCSPPGPRTVTSLLLPDVGLRHGLALVLHGLPEEVRAQAAGDALPKRGSAGSRPQLGGPGRGLPQGASVAGGEGHSLPAEEATPPSQQDTTAAADVAA